jgi:hypothetical protein
MQRGSRPITSLLRPANVKKIAPELSFSAAC